ncbi:flagellar biosynthetic protein FliR [Granulicella tundricola]|uniref:Flagellar biosynthetic protein FliR n=1 Tax=Granulicella tundricola (strain ATCC BAA-1859 / DSM 23138 / MP5ACTX9) TaxID=1198114 RepID=E8X630_GRATM|nr:flagellar biosynthetic protein FliR [Granulicella tundricola]ADW70914.1 flagellar biosynthetic protein FliR [Granulicella tundricola MP5ACTX9]
MQIPFADIIQAFLAIGVRLSGLMLFAPFLGSAVIPARIKAVLVVALTFVIYPLVSRSLTPQPLNDWPLLVFRELLVGVSIGIATSVVFEAVQMAGQILSIQMGYSLINILDPNTQVDTTVIAMFHQSIAMLIFLRLDVHLWLIRAIGNSFTYLPPGGAQLSRPFMFTLIGAGSAILSIGVQIAAPVLSATLLTDIVLGLLGKASPQLPLMLLGPAVKSLLGLAILFTSLKYWPDMFRVLFIDSMGFADRLLHLAAVAR